MDELTLLRSQIDPNHFFAFYNQIEQKVLFDGITIKDGASACSQNLMETQF